MCAVVHIPTKNRPNPEQSTDGRWINERPRYCEILKSVTHLFDGGKRGKPLLSQFDSQVREAVELILQFEEHLFRLCYSDLVLQGLELRADVCLALCEYASRGPIQT